MPTQGRHPQHSEPEKPSGIARNGRYAEGATGDNPASRKNCAAPADFIPDADVVAVVSDIPPQVPRVSSKTSKHATKQNSSGNRTPGPSRARPPKRTEPSTALDEYRRRKWQVLESNGKKLDLINRQVVRDLEHRDECHKELKKLTENNCRATLLSLQEIKEGLQNSDKGDDAPSTSVMSPEQEKRLCHVSLSKTIRIDVADLNL